MAFDAFFKINGIPGESQDSKHAQEIDVKSFSWGVHNTGTAASGTGGSGSGKGEVQDFTFVHAYDSASPLLVQYSITGKIVDTATLTIRKSGGDPLEYLVYELDNVLISSVSTGGSSGADDIPMETVSLNFQTFKITYQPQAAAGTGSGNVTAGYNLATQAAAA